MGLIRVRRACLGKAIMASSASTSVKHVYAVLIWGITRNIEVLFLEGMFLAGY